MAQTIILIHGESTFTPGRITKAAATKEGADIAAAELVNLLRDEHDLPADATPADWDEKRMEFRRARAEALEVSVDDLTETDCGDVWIQENVEIYVDLKPTERP